MTCVMRRVLITLRRDDNNHKWNLCYKNYPIEKWCSSTLYINWYSIKVEWFLKIKSPDQKMGRQKTEHRKRPHDTYYMHLFDWMMFILLLIFMMIYTFVLNVKNDVNNRILLLESSIWWLHCVVCFLPLFLKWLAFFSCFWMS